MNIQKRLLVLVAAAVLICTMSMSAYANDVLDTNEKGSIHMIMQYEDKAVPGGTLTLYHVGDILENDEGDTFVLTDAFAESGESLENIQSARLAKQLAQYAKDHNIKGTEKKIDSKGSVLFSGLSTGLYLIIQTKAADGYNAAEPFLVSVPMQENGVYIYNVDASPKIELFREPETTPTKTPEVPSKPMLPQTGQLNWPVPVMVVLGLILFSAGWTLRCGKKKGSYEK